MNHRPMGRVLVLEPSPRWAPELQRQWRAGEIVVEASPDLASWQRALSGGGSKERTAQPSGLVESHVFAPPPLPPECSFPAPVAPARAIFGRAGSAEDTDVIPCCGVYVLAHGAAPLLSQLQTWNARGAVPPVVVVAERQLSELQWALYEAGIVHVAYEPMSGARMRQLIARVLRASP